MYLKSKNNSEVRENTSHYSFSSLIRFKNTKSILLCICTNSNITDTWHRHLWGYNFTSQLFYFGRIFLNRFYVKIVCNSLLLWRLSFHHTSSKSLIPLIIHSRYQPILHYFWHSLCIRPIVDL